MGDCGKPGRPNVVVRLGGAHTFCTPPQHRRHSPLDVRIRSPVDICPPPQITTDPRPSRHRPVQKHSIDFLSLPVSCLRTSHPATSFPEMSLQSTLVKIALNSPQFARFFASSTITPCRFVPMGTLLSHNDVSQHIIQPPCPFLNPRTIPPVI